MEQFLHISRANFAILFSSEILKRKTRIFRSCNFFSQTCFLHSGDQVSAYHAYIFTSLISRFYLSIKSACLHNLCMNRASLDRVSWTSTNRPRTGTEVLHCRTIYRRTHISAEHLSMVAFNDEKEEFRTQWPLPNKKFAQVFFKDSNHRYKKLPSTAGDSGIDVSAEHILIFVSND